MTLEILKIDGKPSGKKVKLDDDILDDLMVSWEDKRKFLSANLDLVAEIAQNEVTKSDLIGLAYRKKQLDIFQRLLSILRYQFLYLQENLQKQLLPKLRR